MFNKIRLATLIKEIRIANELNQTQFGEKIGLTKTAVSSLETGHRQPSLETLYTISKEFQISADYLLGLKDK
ncbi:helix-turn-helix transcriptional regulator [Brevibacillus centrosporus]|uniref:helix-turn-helix domain-containing protein n=1 Tax=Brevibacillus centrosporus TaxID=54910 RepID=UPI002E2048EB|nr:helix-turn-helix transcriptional regulator [Brevibacillus centrosporus]